MPRIFLAIPTMNERLLDKCLFNAWSRAVTSPGTLVWFNGMSYSDAHTATLHMGEMRNKIGGPIILRTDFSAVNLGVPAALTKLYKMADIFQPQLNDFILFVHDDVLFEEEAWDQKCLEWLKDRPECAVFGWGGAKGLGDPDLYKKPYQLQQLARRGFISNMTKAEDHGARVLEPTRVATLDGFSLGVRYDFLEQLDGWNWWPQDLPHHSYDNALCCMAKRHGKEVWMLPIRANHLGGQTATKVDYQSDFGQQEADIHSGGHVWLYNEFRDQLPIQV